MTVGDDTSNVQPEDRSAEGLGQVRPAIPQGLEAALLAAIVENSDDAIASKDLSGVVTSWNRAAERLFGYTADEIIGRQISVLAAPGREDEMPMILERIRRGERVEHFDTLRRRKDGSLVEISLTVSPVRDVSGRIVGASKIARDISARRRLEEERELRVGELRHRVKNLLAMVVAIAHQTAVTDQSAREYRDSFMGRIVALAAAHDAAFQKDGVDLATLVTRLLEPYAHGAEHEAFLIEPSPPVNVPSGKVQGLAFVVHELATNAVKHGALSTPGGRVQLGWRVDGAQEGKRCLSLTWRELGGPPVTPPAVRGFGLKLIDIASAGELGGGAQLTFEPEGVEAKIKIRLD